MTEDYIEEDVLLHYGTPRHSGRYPYGSGKDPQRNRSFLNDVDDAKAALRKKGITNPSGKQVADHLGITTTELRSKTTLANEEMKARLYEEVHTRMARGESVKEISEATGISTGSVRNYASKDPNSVAKKATTDAIADQLKEAVDRTGYLDVGKGVEAQIGISPAKMKATIDKLKEEGYHETTVWVPQVSNPSQYTTMKVLTKHETTKGEIMKNQDKIKPIDFHTVNGDGMSLQNLQTPKSIDWNRVKIRYAIPEGEKGHGGEDDGAAMDGSMTIRPGVKDLTLGAGKHYAQVRIAVGGTHYLKGVALYGEDKDFPKGVDIIFNTNKTKDVPREKVLKPLKDKLDGANPFGATIKRQNALLDAKGMAVNLMNKGKAILDKRGKPMVEAGAINIVNEEGDWAEWSKSLSAQFLSKQPRPVVKERLDATMKKLQKEYDEIQKVENPVIKKKLLEAYSSDLESKQVHLKAVAPKGFAGHLILPIPKMKENEVYAPNYKDGDNVVLIRYPHGGRFEIPELRVNNKGPGKKIVGPNSPDAIGIHPKVAAKLSGADFDGDTVYVIPNNSKKYKSRSALKGLEGFEPSQYADDPKTFKPIGKKNKQIEMGKVSNLITDMTLKGASDSELARAVRHSMVVIDAEKHNLNYKRSERENSIDALKKKYQVHINKVDYSKLKKMDYSAYEKGKEVKAISSEELKKYNGKQKAKGAATIISRHKQEVVTGGKEVRVEVIDKKTGKVKLDKNGNPKTKLVIRNEKKSFLIPMLKDASVLLNKDSTQVEKDYVKYVNDLKSLKNKIDKERLAIKNPKRDPKAAFEYKDAVDSLKFKLKQSQLNAPRERQAQLLARQNYDKELKRKGGEKALGSDDVKKLRNQALIGARSATGAQRQPVVITDREWHAIQKNAISSSMLKELTKHMDDKQLKELATPRPKQKVSDNHKAKAEVMLRNGYTLSQIAQALGVSPSTISAIKADANIKSKPKSDSRSTVKKSTGSRAQHSDLGSMYVDNSLGTTHSSVGAIGGPSLTVSMDDIKGIPISAIDSINVGTNTATLSADYAKTMQYKQEGGSNA